MFRDRLHNCNQSINKTISTFRSFFQSVCVLGYCLLAPASALALCRAVLLAGRSTTLFIIRLVIALSAFLWSTASCMIFLGESQAQGRKILAGYPVCLFYAVISWLVISHTDQSTSVKALGQVLCNRTLVAGRCRYSKDILVMTSAFK